jgi:hypothetical protein
VAWAGRGFCSPLRDTLLVRAVPPGARGRAFGLERALDQVGAVLAPLIVLALLAISFNLRAIIALSLVPDLAAVDVARAIHPSNPRHITTESLGRFTRKLQRLESE